MRIQHNIAALNSYSRLGNNNSAISKNLEKLSSGYRINRAGDDAAGLAISEKMRAQITSLDTAKKNANDGISLTQSAEGALTEVHSMLNRMVELAGQSANGTYDNSVDRKQLQKEVSSLQSEIDRISDGTTFNGISLLDGSLSGSSTAGGLTGSSIVNFKGATGSAAGTDASTTPAAATTGKYTVKVDTAFTDGKDVTIGGVAIHFKDDGTGDVQTGTGHDDDQTKQAASMVTLLNNDSTFKNHWTATAAGDTITITNKDAGDTTAFASVAGTDAGNVTQTGADGKAAAGIDFFQKDTINIDGTEVKVDWSKLNDTERSALQKDWTASGSPTNADAKKAGEIIQKTINEAIDNHNAANGTNLNHIKAEGSVSGSAASFAFTSGLKDGNSKITFTGTSNTVLGQVASGNLTTNTQTQTLAPATSDVTGHFTMKLGEQTLDVNLSGITGSTDVASQVQSAIDSALSNYDSANNLSGTDAMSGKVNVKLNKDGALEFVNNTGKELGFEDKGDGEVAKNLGISTQGKSLGNGGLTLQIGDTADSFNKMTVQIDSMSSKSLGILGIDISTQAGASSAIDKIKKAINTVSSTRGDLGAIQNRLEHTINNLSVSSQNMTAAESRIRDVDMAQEMMEYTKNNILVSASQSMLAQANQLPKGILQLLQ